MDIFSIHQRFSSNKQCIQFLEQLRWPEGIFCPICFHRDIRAIPKKNRHHCKSCGNSFSVLKGSIFERSKISLVKWFQGISLMLNAKKGIPARQLARDLNINKDSAWSMSTKVRIAMCNSYIYKLQLKLEKQGVFDVLKNTSTGQELLTGRNRELYKFALLNLQEIKKVIFANSLEQAGINVQIADKMQRLLKRVQQNISGIEDLEITALKVPEQRGKNQLIDFNYYMNNQFGYWHMFKRSLYGQYHRISLKYAQLYINEIVYKQEKGSGFQDLLQRALLC